MSDYSKTTNFTAKDSLPSGNANKVIKGSEFDLEFGAIQTAVATKANKVASATNNNILTMDSNGDLQDSGASATGGVVTADLTGDVTGNADTATALETARTIGGVSFDGTANINLPGVNTTGNQDTTGTSVRATSNLTTDAVGSFAFLRHETVNTAITYGTDYAGSSLTPSGVTLSTGTQNVNWDAGADSSRAGTWKCLSNVAAVASQYSAGLFVRH